MPDCNEVGEIYRAGWPRRVTSSHVKKSPAANVKSAWQVQKPRGKYKIRAENAKDQQLLNPYPSLLCAILYCTAVFTGASQEFTRDALITGHFISN